MRQVPGKLVRACLADCWFSVEHVNANRFDLTGHTSVITGAARGLSRATAVGPAMHGADVAVVDLDRDRGGDTVGEIMTLRRRAVAYGCDVAEEAAVHATAEQIHRDFSRIDILVTVAGSTARIPTAEIESATVRRLTEVNYRGTFWIGKKVVRFVLAHGGGNSVNMSALAGGLLGTGHGNAAHSSTKGALAALTNELARACADEGIRVNAVAPCWFRTDMNATSVFADMHFTDQLLTKPPMYRIDRPPQSVVPLLFLVSDASSYVDGHVSVDDDGWMER